MSPDFNDTWNVNCKSSAQVKLHSQWGDIWMKIMNKKNK